MKNLTRTACAAIAIGFAGTVTASAATLCRDGVSDYAIVADTNVSARVAAEELQDIFAQSTGVTLPILARPSGGADGRPARRFIYVGRSAAAQAAFGEDTLAANEYAMTEKKPAFGLFGGGDIWLRGTGDDGTRLAVYRFCEDTLGYRCFMPEPDCERIVKTATVRTDGRGFRHVVAFPMGRGLTHIYLYGDKPDLTKFLFRNGSGCPARWLAKTPYDGLTRALEQKDEGHGFFLYLPCKRLYMDAYPWDARIDFFAEHPEWYSMNRAGKRTDRMQLCFSNPELRKAFARRVLERCRRVGGEGVLTIGAQDVPGAFCWCKPCQVLQKKYETPAGAYWDYLPELCAAVAREYPKIRIMTLAYRKEQSENFPTGVKRFPDNFVCDFAPVDDDLAFNIGGKGNEKTLANLKKWCAACKTVGYWYYACTKHPYGLVSRPSGDLRISHAAGVSETKLCGLYAPGFGPLLDWLFLRLALDPAQDPWVRVKEFCDFMYGAASEDVQALARELDALWREPTPFVGIDVEATALKCYRGPDLVRWQQALDAAERKVADDARATRWLSLVRWDIDMLTLQFWRDVRGQMERPRALTPDAIYARMRNVVHLKRYQSQPETEKSEPTGLYDKAKNAYLVALALDKPVPAPLDGLPEDQVIQIPQCGGYHGVVDPDAACGRAKSEIYRPGSAIFTNGLVRYDYYNTNLKRMIKTGTFSVKGFAPGKFALYKIADVTIPVGACINLASWWGIGQSLSNYYPEGDADRVFGLWASLKFIGPDFGLKTEDGKNRMICDRFFLVDRNGKKYRGE